MGMVCAGFGDLVRVAGAVDAVGEAIDWGGKRCDADFEGELV
jgi:hypothetical protein